MPSARVVFNYEIFNTEGKLVHTGETILVFVNRETNRLTKAPKELTILLQPYFAG